MAVCRFCKVGRRLEDSMTNSKLEIVPLAPYCSQCGRTWEPAPAAPGNPLDAPHPADQPEAAR